MIDYEKIFPTKILSSLILASK